MELWSCVMQSSSIYPLFKPGASSLGGACLAAHVTIQPCSSFSEVNAITRNCRMFVLNVLSISHFICSVKHTRWKQQQIQKHSSSRAGQTRHRTVALTAADSVLGFVLSGRGSDVHCVSKKGPTLKLSVTLSNLNRFSTVSYTHLTLPTKRIV